MKKVSYHLAKVIYHLVKVSYHLAKVSYHLGNVSLHPFGKKSSFHKIIQSESEKIAILHFKPAHFYACAEPRPGFPMSYVMVFFMFNELR